MDTLELTYDQLQSRLAEAERRQQESEYKYRSLFDNRVAGISITDVSGRLMEANETLCDLLGYSLKELRQLNVGLLYARPKKREEFLEVLFRDGTARDFLLELIRKSGKPLWASFSSAVIKWQGKDAIVTTIIDVTERKLAEEFLKCSEQKYRTLVETSPYSIHQIDIEGRIMSMNRAGLEMLGVADESAVVGLPYLEAVCKEDQERVSRLLEDGFSGSSRDFDFRSTGGLDFCSTIVPKFDSQGKVDRLLGITQDLTDHKRNQLKLVAVEKELQQKEAEISKVSRLSTLGELTSGIAHELNQPLTAIANYVEAIKDIVQLESRDTNDLHEILSNLGNTTFRTSAIISRLRGLIQKASLHRTAMNLNELAEELMEFRMPWLERSHIQIRLELSEDLPLLVIDPIQIQQVLLNLVNNAQEAMESTMEDRRVMTIRTRHVDESVELSITDSGRGLPAENVGRLFDYFFTTTPGGLGVGLQVCRTIMEAHQGSVVAQNNPAGGATFLLSFPLKTREASYVL
ncbi:MAG: PAS domain S-box protein [Planctomycetes bacterium]|nr:PAS domain S-box protein [Planctomycetota bacterium]